MSYDEISLSSLISVIGQDCAKTLLYKYAKEKRLIVDPDISVYNMTFKQLKQFASNHNVSIGSDLDCDDVLNLLQSQNLILPDKYYDNLRTEKLSQIIHQSSRFCQNISRLIANNLRGQVPPYLTLTRDKKAIRIYMHQKSDASFLPYQSALLSNDILKSIPLHEEKYSSWRTYLCTRQYFVPKTCTQAAKIASYNRWVLYHSGKNNIMFMAYGPDRQYAHIYCVNRIGYEIKFFNYKNKLIETFKSRFLSLLLTQFSPSLVQLAECGYSIPESLKTQISIIHQGYVFYQYTNDYTDRYKTKKDYQDKIDHVKVYFQYLDHYPNKQIWMDCIGSHVCNLCVSNQFADLEMMIEDRQYFQDFYFKHFDQSKHQDDVYKFLEKREIKTFTESEVTDCLTFLDDRNKDSFLTRIKITNKKI